jgi:uncharacterized repeat protein (TIGR03847 family)
VTHEFTTEDIAVGTVGPPGERVFYVQVREGERAVTLKAEKQQIAALGDQLVEILDRLADSHGEDPVEPEPGFSLVGPLESLFAIATIGVGYDEARDLVLLQLEAAPADDPAEGLPPDDEPETVRVWASRTRLRSVARHALEVVAGGRPNCDLCGFPKGENHICPRSNGHGASA